MYVKGYDHSRKFGSQTKAVRCQQMARYHTGRALRFHFAGAYEKAAKDWTEAKRLAKAA